MKILGRKIGERFKEANIENSLPSMQDFVGGYIEIIDLPKRFNNIVIVANDSGIIDCEDINLAIVHSGVVTTVLAGNLFFCSAKEDELEGLSESQIKLLIDNLTYKKGEETDTHFLFL